MMHLVIDAAETATNGIIKEKRGNRFHKTGFTPLERAMLHNEGRLLLHLAETGHDTRTRPSIRPDDLEGDVAP